MTLGTNSTEFPPVEWCRWSSRLQCRGLAHRQDCVPSNMCWWGRKQTVCYMDAFGVLPFLPLFSEACRTDRLYLSLLIPPKYFLNEPLFFNHHGQGIIQFHLKKLLLARDESLPDKDRDINDCLLRFCFSWDNNLGAVKQLVLTPMGHESPKELSEMEWPLYSRARIRVWLTVMFRISSS